MSLRSSLIYLLILVGLGVLFLPFLLPGQSSEELPITTVIEMAKQNQIERIEVDGDTITLWTKTNQVWKSRLGDGTDLLELLERAGVRPGSIQVEYKAASQFGNIFGILLNLLPLALVGMLFFFLMRQTQGGGGSQLFSFGRSRARLITGNRPAVTFADVAGVDEAKEELQEVIEFLKYPERFAALGARIPKGVLLVGPPGTGKTLLSRAVAGEAGVPFFSISGSEFVEMFVGVGAARVRDLFAQAKRNAPCIIFVDELDAVGRHRGAGLGGGHDEREQTLNQILVELDGFDTNTNVIVLSATNRPDILDPALLRPGRFDRRVVLDQPDINGRKAILEIHARGKPLGEEVDLKIIAKQTPGFSGADLANLINEAAILTARRDKTTIGNTELEEAVDRVIAGPQRKSRIISQKEREITAHHEAGHALVARMLPDADRVHKMSIVTRGRMGGYTRLLPTEDRYLWTRSQFNDMLASTLGGHAAEELIFGEISTGGQNDIERATKVARKMVTEYGMSEKLGPRAFGRKEELVFLGRDIMEQRNYSEKVAEEIDNEVQAIVDRAYNVAKDILTQHRARLVRIAKRLLEEETLEGEALEALFTEPIPSPALPEPETA